MIVTNSRQSAQRIRRPTIEAIGSTPVPPTKLLVEAHGDATHEKVVLAMDAGTEVGLQEVQVMMTEREAF